MGLPRFKDPDLDQYKAMLAYMRPTPSLASWVRTAQIMFDSTQLVLLKSATPQAAMDAAAKQIQAILEK
jgi:maltose-binding protein MalE